jgi:diamine N-acetyltransferase
MTRDAISLVPVDRDNWREVVDLEVTPEQRAFVAPPARYLTMCAYDGVWTPLAIRFEGRIVGMLMWAIDPDDGACCLGGVLVDRRWQRRGIGRRAVEHALARLAEHGATSGFALSYHPDNQAARRTYAALGFAETGEVEGDEVVARRGPASDGTDA